MSGKYFYTDVSRIGNKIHCIGYANGKKFYNKIDYKPKLYLYTNKQTEYKSIRGRYLEPIQFDSISDASRFINEYKDVQNFDFCGMEKFEYAFIAEEFGDKLDYDLNDIVILYIDTEVSAEDGFPSIDRADKEFTLITAKYKDTYYTFGINDYTPKADNVKYIKCVDERQLLTKFIAFWDMVRPDVISGWHIEGFDIPYLIRRINNVLGPEASKKLSPYGRINERNFSSRFGKEQIGYEICGVAIYDYMDIYKKFSNSQQESYKLDHIAYVELGVKKLDYSEYGNLTQLYNENFEKYVDYNIRDTELIYELEKKKNLIQLALTMAYSARCNLIDVFKQTVMWDCIIYNYLLKDNVIVPRRKQKPFREFPGAYVKDPVPGMYDWVTTFDLNSLYPSLIMHYNMGPDTYIDEVELNRRIATETDTHKINALKLLLGNMQDGRISLNNAFKGEHINILVTDEVRNTYGDILKLLNFSMAPNGALFDISYKGFLAELLEQMYNNRSSNKKKATDLKKYVEDNKHSLSSNEIKKLYDESALFDNIQLVLKIQLNSAYGALANEGYRFFEVNVAEAITTGGQLTIQWTEDKLNLMMNKLCETEQVDYVIYGDTDSIALYMGPLIKKNDSRFTTKTDIVDFIDSFSEKRIQPYFDKIFLQLKEYMNASQQKMKMKREKICDKVIYSAKKRYIANSLDTEGVRHTEPKISVTGIESVRTSVPQICRDALVKAYKIMMTGTEDELIDFVNDFRNEYKNKSFEEVAFPRSANNLDEYTDKTSIYKKATPIHVRGCLLYNHYLKQWGLDKQYETIKPGEKVKYCYLTVPNKIRENVIACPTYLPKEFNLTEHIDYNTMFDKSFYSPLKSITDIIGWQIEERSSLEMFFS